ncbi:MAG: hypothetical protein JSR87_12795 [Proteobacteria bacterium]|nr:hypothetical protein [Pseudomonadota bacterium]MBS0572477.1 hypothetical protein [Pseudomonadota bacterium]
MRKLALPLTLIMSLAAGSGAMAAANILNGTIRSYEPKSHRLVMDDGTTYILAADCKNEKSVKCEEMGLKAGQVVELHWTSHGDSREASSVSLK